MPAQNLPGLMLDYAHPLSRGLVGWWPMNEGGGTRVSDISGKGNHGALVNGGFFAGNRLGGGIYLDGSNDHVIVPDSESLSIVGDITLSYWIASAYANYSMPVCKGSTSIAAPFYTFIFPGGSARLFARGNGTIEAADAGVSVQVPVNVLTHVAVTMAGTATAHYQNGALVGTGSVSATIADAGGPLYFGRRGDGYYTKMFAAQFRIYNRALSAVEIAQIYAEPLAGALAPLRAARFYVRGFKAAWASRSNQIIGGG